MLVSTWLVPLAALGSIAWFKPAWGVPVLGALTAGVVILSGWAALDPDVRALEDRIGPFTIIALFAVAVAVGALGHARIRAAGIMLLVLGTAAALLSALARPATGPRLAVLVVGAPLILTGILYLAADRMDTPAPRGTQEPSSRGLGRAA